MKEIVRNIGKVVGVRNRLGVILGREPHYSRKELNQIAARGAIPVIMHGPSGEASQAGLVLWDSVYDALREAGLSEQSAGEEVNSLERRLILNG